MLSPKGEDALDAGTPDRLEIPLDARVARLERRAAALERQLEARIAEVDALKDRLAEQDGLTAGVMDDDPVRAWQNAEIVRQKAAEYDALMSTLTMRMLRRPRAWYARARRRLRRP